MAQLKERIVAELGLKCYDPANGQTVSIPTITTISALVSVDLFRSVSSLLGESPNVDFNACCLIAPSDTKDPKQSFKKPRIHMITEDELVLLGGEASVSEKQSQYLAFNPFAFISDSELVEPDLAQFALDTAFKLLTTFMYVPVVFKGGIVITCGDNVNVVVEGSSFKVTWSLEGENEAIQTLAILNKV